MPDALPKVDEAACCSNAEQRHEGLGRCCAPMLSSQPCVTRNHHEYLMQ